MTSRRSPTSSSGSLRRGRPLNRPGGGRDGRTQDGRPLCLAGHEIRTVRPRMSEPGDSRTPEVPAGVAVVTDSTPYLPAELVDRWAMHQVSLYVGWDGDLRPE